MTRGSVCINIPGVALRAFHRHLPNHCIEVGGFDAKLVAGSEYVTIILLWPPSDIKWLSYKQLSEAPR